MATKSSDEVQNSLAQDISKIIYGAGAGEVTPLSYEAPRTDISTAPEARYVPQSGQAAPAPASQPVAAQPEVTPLSYQAQQAPATSSASQNVAGTGMSASEIGEAAAGLLDGQQQGAQQEGTQAKTGDSGISGQQIAGIASSIIGEITEYQAEMAYQQYATEMNNFIKDGAYWFDPRFEDHVELDEVLGQLPSAQDALIEAQMFSNVIDEDNSVAFGFLDPVSYIVSHAYEDGDDAAQLQEYMMQKVGERGLEGASSTGSPWGLLFGLVGVVEALVTWDDVQEQDRQAQERARKAYQQKLNEYHALRGQIQEKQQAQRSQQLAQIAQYKEAQQKQEDIEQINAATRRRAALLDFAQTLRSQQQEREPQYIAL